MILANGWTGGQYSLFRALFGAYLFIHFVQLVPWGVELFSNQGMLPEASASPLVHLFPNVLAVMDAPAMVTAFLVVAASLSVLFAVGFHDRATAFLLWYIWACLFGRNPLIGNPGLPYVGWMLLAHVCLPPAPYGSWTARARIDPGGGWRMPPDIFAVAWVLMALGYSYSGYTKLVSPSWLDGTALAHVLQNPLARPTPLREWMLTLPAGLLRVATWGALALELGFAPLALFARLRPWLWGAMLFMHLSLIGFIDFADLSLGMVMLHLFTFNPAWLPPLTGPTEMVFYDGHCGLCHRAVRFLLAEDRGEAFHFAPLGGDAFQAAIPEDRRTCLPDSNVLQTADGRLLVRSAAVIHMVRRLGGVWRLLGETARFMPARLLDWFYDGIASVRQRLFRSPAETCPLLPPHLRKRFET
jgi:predicted DCC family thiol-disulfide oxidoreductase YuxK